MNPAVARLGAYVLVVGLSAGGMWRVETTARKAQAAAEDARHALAQIEADRLKNRELACVDENDDNARLRRIGKHAPLEAIEGLIELTAEGDDPPGQVLIDRLREIEGRRLDGIVNQLPNREWDPDTGECVDVPLDTGE